MEILHTYTDGSILILTDIREILTTAVWNGNRILDTSHVASIKNSLKLQGLSIENLDSGYHIIRYKEQDATGAEIIQEYLIDGQHRRAVIADEIGFSINFQVTCRVTTVKDEFEAIQTFNRINNSKPILFKEDATQIANRFIEKLVALWGGKKFIRSSKTTRPYLHVDDIRKSLLSCETKLRASSPDDFMKKVIVWNQRKTREIELEITLNSRTQIKEYNLKDRALKIGWVLGIDTALPWVSACL